MDTIIDFTYISGSFWYVIGYVKVTLWLTLLSVSAGTILGLISAAAHVNQTRFLYPLARGYVLVCRSLPNMVLLYLVYYGLPVFFMALEGETGIHVPFERVPAELVAVIGLSLHTGAYLSEIFRAAIQSVSAGQAEAALSLGMTRIQVFRRVIFPQASVFALPLFANQFLSTMKSTSICFVITVVELFGAAKLYCEDNSQYFEAYIVVAFLYWGMGIFFEFLFRVMEYRAGKFRRGNIA
jgi:polar amino acid transport system permease protein/L-cystine transport system permease protein